MPVATPPPADDVILGAVGEARQTTDGPATYWVLITIGSALIVLGWFLPWFVTAYSAGVGYAPMDVVVSAPQGPTVFGVYILALCMVTVIAVSAYDRYASRRWGHPPGLRWQQARAVAAPAGLAASVLTWLCARVFITDGGFGNVVPGTITDSAVWLTWLGYATLTIALWPRSWVHRHPNAALGIVAAAFGLLFPLMFHQAVDLVYWGAASLAVYTLLGLGLNVVVGFAGLLDLGYAAFFAIGAYTCASFASPYHHLHWPFWIIVFIGAAVASLSGAILGAPTLRLRGDYLAIVTLGFGEIIPDLATNNMFTITGGPNGISAIDTASFFGLTFTIRDFYWALVILLGAAIVTLRNLERSRIGRAWVALREDEIAAAATGINTTTTKLLAFSIGASVSGFAGAFYGSLVSIVSPDDFGFTVSVTVLSIVVLGGIGNITGVILGSSMLTFVIFWALPHMQEWMSTFGDHSGATFLGNIHYTDFTYAVYGVILVATMLLRPGGILPSRARKVEFAAGVAGESVSDVAGTT